MNETMGDLKERFDFSFQPASKMTPSVGFIPATLKIINAKAVAEGNPVGYFKRLRPTRAFSAYKPVNDTKSAGYLQSVAFIEKASDPEQAFNFSFEKFGNMTISKNPFDIDTAAFDHHLKFLFLKENDSSAEEVKTTPLFTMPVLKNQDGVFSTSSDQIKQYGLLSGSVDENFAEDKAKWDPRIFQNISAPSSTFICGSQGSGKSHTLSCMLENCLIPSELGKLPEPLTGLLFHYDNFTSDMSGSACEAAYLSSSKAVEVRVFCSPSNIETIKVSSLSPNLLSQ